VLSLIGPSDSDLNFTATESILNINHKLNDGPHPIVGHSGANNAVPYAGDAVISTRVTTCNAVLLLTGGGNGAVGDEYRQASIGGSDAVLQNTWDIGRRRGYLVPE
jgi:hypothetical protein